MGYARLSRDATGFDDVALARYNRDGLLDGTFGTGGKVTISFSGNDPWWGREHAYAVALQPDGRIVIAGDVSTR